MLRLAADLPDPLVRSRPGAFEVAKQGSLERPRVLLLGEAVGPCLVERVHDFAVDVHLELLARGVADAHGRRALVAG